MCSSLIGRRIDSSTESFDEFVLIKYFHILASKTKYVTCGSVAKLKNVDHNVRLHSHDVKYGTGSGQQSVTGTELTEDVNSHWSIWTSNEQCERG